jgi:hypothetical protein
MIGLFGQTYSICLIYQAQRGFLSFLMGNQGMRSDNCPQRLLRKERLSREIKAYSIFRCREKQTIRILDKQFDSACPDNYGAFSMSMADRVVFQMDKTTSTD